MSIDLKTIAISTKNIIYESTPILKVSHDDDGIWQFLDGSIQLNEDDAIVISLETILNIDLTVKEILNLPMGSVAFRKNLSSKWIITNHN